MVEGLSERVKNKQVNKGDLLPKIMQTIPGWCCHLLGFPGTFEFQFFMISPPAALMGESPILYLQIRHNIASNPILYGSTQ